MAGCPYESQIRAAAIRAGINPDVAVAQMMQESGCNPNVCSNAGACGIAQFLPGTWSQYGSGSRSDVNASLNAWAAYFSHLLSKFGGDYRLALAGYHSGEGAAKKALANCQGNPKTCGYVNSILGNAGSGAGSPAAIATNGDARAGSSVLSWVIVGFVALLILRR